MLAAVLGVPVAAAFLPAIAHATPTAPHSRLTAPTTQYIVQAATTADARRRVLRVGGDVRRELGVIHGVVAELTTDQVAHLQGDSALSLFKDQRVTSDASNPTGPAGTAGLPSAYPVTLTDGTSLTLNDNQYVTDYPFLAGATPVQQSGITGRGVTIAMLDTGIWTGVQNMFQNRIIASVDILSGTNAPVTSDPYGHGTHITSIAAGGAVSPIGTYFGIAPNANLVIVRAFDATGAGSYANVIAGLGWVIANKQKYNIRVLNLSFSAPPQSNYWLDPLNQAVMAAWKAGIVVVVAAGNKGPAPHDRRSARQRALRHHGGRHDGQLHALCTER